MRSVFALIRASFLTASSYRLASVLSLIALLASVVPLYFVSGALQPVVQDSIKLEGGDYFPFLLVGLGAIYLLSAAVGAVPSALAGSLGSGTLEALLVTRTRLPFLLLGMVGYPLLQSVLRAMLLLGGGLVIGVQVSWSAFPAVILVSALLVAAYLAVGLVAAALVLVFRTAGPLGTAVIAGSGLLGGVYYSTTVIPAWLQNLSAIVPLTYALRAMRRLLLSRAAFSDVLPDITILALIAAVALAVGGAIFVAALRYARSAGTLSQA